MKKTISLLVILIIGVFSCIAYADCVEKKPAINTQAAAEEAAASPRATYNRTNTKHSYTSDNDYRGYGLTSVPFSVLNGVATIAYDACIFTGYPSNSNFRVAASISSESNDTIKVRAACVDQTGAEATIYETYFLQALANGSLRAYA